MKMFHLIRMFNNIKYTKGKYHTKVQNTNYLSYFYANNFRRNSIFIPCLLKMNLQFGQNTKRTNTFYLFPLDVCE